MKQLQTPQELRTKKLRIKENGAKTEMGLMAFLVKSMVIKEDIGVDLQTE